MLKVGAISSFGRGNDVNISPNLVSDNVNLFLQRCTLRSGSLYSVRLAWPTIPGGS